MTRDPDSPADADLDDVLDVEPPVTLSEALGEESGTDLSTIPGVGEVFAARLQNHGISEPAEVAELAVAELADALGTSEGRAERIRDAARRGVRD